MGMNFKRKLPIPKVIKEQFPLSEKIIAHKAERDEEIRKVFTGELNKLLLVIGPCFRRQRRLCYGLYLQIERYSGKSQG